jgi:hypothetical protein
MNAEDIETYSIEAGTDFDEHGASVDVVTTPGGHKVAVTEHGWYSAQREAVPTSVGVAAAMHWEHATGKRISAPGWRYAR